MQNQLNPNLFNCSLRNLDISVSVSENEPLSDRFRETSEYEGGPFQNKVVGYVQSGCYDMHPLKTDALPPVISKIQKYEQTIGADVPQWNHLHIDELIVNRNYSKRHNPIKNKDIQTGMWLLYKWSAEFCPAARSTRMNQEEYGAFTSRERTNQNDIRHEATRKFDRFDEEANCWEVGPRISLHVDMAKYKLVQWYSKMGFVRCYDAVGTRWCPNPNPLLVDVGEVYEMRVGAYEFFEYMYKFYKNNYIDQKRSSPGVEDGYLNKYALYTPTQLSGQYCHDLSVERRRVIDQGVSIIELYEERAVLCPAASVISGMVDLLIVEYKSEFSTYLYSMPGDKAIDIGDIELYALQRLLSFRFKRGEMNEKKWKNTVLQVKRKGRIERDDPAQNNLCYVVWLDSNHF